MALTSKKYSAIHTKTGGDLTSMQDKFDNAKHLNIVDFEPDAAIIYQMQKMQDELDYLRTEISTNKDNRIVIGSSTTISFGDMVTVTDPKSGKVTGYNIVMTVVNGGTTKTTTLSLT